MEVINFGIKEGFAQILLALFFKNHLMVKKSCNIEFKILFCHLNNKRTVFHTIRCFLLLSRMISYVISCLGNEAN